MNLKTTKMEADVLHRAKIYCTVNNITLYKFITGAVRQLLKDVEKIEHDK